MQFEVFRISLLPSGNAPLFTPDAVSAAEKNRLIRNAILGHGTAVYRGKRFQFANVDDAKGALLARLIKPEEIGISIQDPDTGDLVDGSMPNFAWTHILYLGKAEQMIAVHRKPSFFAGTPNGMAAILKGVVKDGIDDERFEVYVAPLSSTAEFWAVVDSASFISSVQFELVTPNVFGGAQSLREALRLSQSMYNATHVHTKLENKENGLTLNDRDAQLTAELDYVGKGGGLWKMLIRDLAGRIRRHSSSELAARVVIETKGIPASLREWVREIVRQMRAIK